MSKDGLIIFFLCILLLIGFMNQAGLLEPMLENASLLWSHIPGDVQKLLVIIIFLAMVLVIAWLSGEGE